MPYNLLGKQVRGRFGFPSGVISTNSDTARWMIKNIPQIGFFVGKSTTIEPKEGNPEDIFIQPDTESGCNAVGYANPGLKEMLEEFKDLKKSVPDDVFLMPQIGECDEERFAHCVREFDNLGDTIDGIELNVSCPHAQKGGILIGSDPEIVKSIVSACRKETKKPLIVKVNAGVPRLIEVCKVALEAGANAISAINTLGGPRPELSNEYGGLSGPKIFPITFETVNMIKSEFIRSEINVPMIVMGGLSSADDIRKLDQIDNNFFYAIGTSLAEMNSMQIKHYFSQLELDLKNNTNLAVDLTKNKKALQYKSFVVKEITDHGDSLKILKFHQNLPSGIGQYVFLKVGNKNSKPFSVASDKDQLEIEVRKVGETTSKIFELKKNSVVRIRGPYGREFSFPTSSTVLFVGAGCGIAPIHHAAQYHDGKKIFVIGAKNKDELVYVDEMKQMGELIVSTDDGSDGYKGFVSQILEKYLYEKKIKDVIFFNCGPEIAMKEVDRIEKNVTKPDKIYHLIERMTSCGVGICGKCSINNGLRACIDGPIFTAENFTPGEYKRDKSGKRVDSNDRSTCPS
ncbi:MAG: tRNA-dihydrouridine synthase [Candidatus Woesearchaeota archaeon]